MININRQNTNPTPGVNNPAEQGNNVPAQTSAGQLMPQTGAVAQQDAFQIGQPSNINRADSMTSEINISSDNLAENSAVELSAENKIIDNKKIEMCFDDFEKALTFKSKKTGKEVHVFRGSAPRDENGEETIDACEYQERHADVLIAHGIKAVCSYNEIKTENVKGQDILEKSKIFWQHMPVKDYQSPSVKEINRGWEILLDAIDNEGNIYIHCGAGLGRTGTGVTGIDILSGKFDKYDSLDKKLIALMQRADFHQVEMSTQKRTLIAMLIARHFVKGNSGEQCDEAFFLDIATELTEKKLASSEIKSNYSEKHKQILGDMNNFIKANKVDKHLEFFKAMEKIIRSGYTIQAASKRHNIESSELSEYLNKNRELWDEVTANPVSDSIAL